MLSLSQAIRIGSLIRPQGFGSTRESARGGIFNLFRKEERTCAWGAAHEANGTEIIETQITEDFIPFRGHAPAKAGSIVRAFCVPPEWTPVSRRWDVCPKCDREDYVERLISHLNDDHQWKRERIADWVEVVEEKVTRETAGQAVKA